MIERRARACCFFSLICFFPLNQFPAACSHVVVILRDFFFLTGRCQSFIIQARARTFVIRLRDDEAKNKILRNKVVVGFFLSDFFLDRLTVRWRGLAETDWICAATPRLQLFPLLPITKQNKSFFFWLRGITPFYFFPPWKEDQSGCNRQVAQSRKKGEHFFFFFCSQLSCFIINNLADSI